MMDHDFDDEFIDDTPAVTDIVGDLREAHRLSGVEGSSMFSEAVDTIVELRASVQWWVETANIKGEQYRAILNLMSTQREAIQHLMLGTDPKIIEHYVNTSVPLDENGRMRRFGQ